MEEEFLNYDQALAFKELGFNKPCFAFFNPENNKFRLSGNSMYVGDKQNELVNAPTFQQAFKWFRDEYKLWFRPDYYDEIRDYFTGSIHKLGRFSALYNLEKYATAEQCESACIDKLIEMVKNETK